MPSFQENLNYFYEWLERIKKIDPAIANMILQHGDVIAGAIANGRIDTSYLNAVEESLRNGDYSILMGNGTPGMEKYVDNKVEEAHTAEDRAYQTEMRDTSVTSTGQQLESLGLSPSNVISVGGASSGVTSSPASTNFHSASHMMAQQRLQKFNTQVGLAKALISTAGSMASSGIYGSALGAVKHSAQALASTAAHSGYAAVKASKSVSNPNWQQDWDNMMKELETGKF